MKYLAFILTLLLTTVSKAQVGEVVGAGYVITASGTDPNFTVTMAYTSSLGWTTANITTNHYVMARSVVGPTHSRNIYDITSVSPAGGNVTLGLTRITGTATATFPSGTHPVIASPGDGLLYDAPNISQMHDSYLYNYNLNKLYGDQFTSFTVNGDSVFLHNTNGDSIYVGADVSAVAVTTLNGLDDVTISLPAAGNLLVHDGVDWKNKAMSGDATITGGGVIDLTNGAVENTEMANMPSNTIKGNNEVGAGPPEDLTVAEAKVLLDIDHLTTLSGVNTANDDLGAFTGTTIPDGSDNKEAMQALETGVETKLPKSLPSAQIYVGNAIGTATAVSMSGDATINNTGIVDVPGLDLKNVNIQFKDEGINLGASGTVNEVDITGAGATATRAANKVTINVTGGGGGGGTNLTYTASPTQGQVNSDTGTDAVLPVVNGTNAGLMTPAMLDSIHDSLTVNEQVNGVSLSFTGTQELAVGLDPNELTNVVAAATDVVMIGDASDAFNVKKVTAQSIADLAPGAAGTNLAVANHTASALDVTSDTGTDATIPSATIQSGTNLAGLITPAEKTQMVQQTIVYAATINANMNSGNIVYVSLTGNAAIAAPTNSVAGEPVIYILSASGADRTATFAATVFKEEDGASDVGAQVITNGTTKVFYFRAGPTVLNRVGGGFGGRSIWNSSGTKTIKTFGTEAFTVTEAAAGTYEITVDYNGGEILDKISFLKTAAAGGSQNAPSQAISFVIDRGTAQSFSTKPSVVVSGIDVSSDDVKLAGSVLAPAVTVNVTTSGNEVTILVGGLDGIGIDGSKVTIEGLNNQ